MQPTAFITSGFKTLLVIKAVGCTCLIDIRLHSMKVLRLSKHGYVLRFEVLMVVKLLVGTKFLEKYYLHLLG
jgi:hypothetical protein